MDGDYRHSSIFSLTQTLVWDEWLTPHLGHLPQGMTPYTLNRRLGEPRGRCGREQKISPPPGLDTRTVQRVASPYTDYSIHALLTCGYVH